MRGAGFASVSAVTLSFGTATVSTCTAGVLTTDSFGSFSCTFPVPSIPAGSPTVTARDASGDSASAPFTVITTYPVTFTESGLPAGTSWSVTLGGVTNTSGTTTIGFEEANGTFSYSIGDVPGWHQTTLPYAGQLIVNGGSITEPTLEFTMVTYTVTFSEAGLPIGTPWWVNLTIGTSSPGTAPNSITLVEPNGSYTFIVGAAGSRYAAPGGTFDVDGASVSPPTVVFSTQRYAVTFTESGLPVGTVWWVNLTGGPSGSSSTSAISFSLVNGSYRYSVATADPTYEAPPGTLLVAGSALTQTVMFSMTYAVTFTEAGLPSGTAWSVTVNGVRQSTGRSSTLVFREPNGSYSYSITDVPGWHQSTLAYSGSVTVSGSAIAEPTLAFTAVAYSVSFVETGLPAGVPWWVNVTGGLSFRSTTGSIAFTLANGSYSFTVSSPGYVAKPSSGSFGINGGPAAEVITFSPALFSVRFVETGLPPGVNWSVGLGGSTQYSTGTTITFQEANGTYAYTIHSSNPQYSAPGGSLTVQGSGLQVPIPFSTRTFAVSFTETGLPSGTRWSVFFNGSTQGSTGPVIVVAVVNGTYVFTVGRVPNYDVSPPYGTVQVAGAPVNITIAFTVVGFLVTFVEQGLPSGTNWSVTLGLTTLSSTTGSISFEAPNSTYSWSVGSVNGYTPTPPFGVLTVAGKATVQSIQFHVTRYAVAFRETGLPLGTNWSVTLNGTTLSSMNGTLAFQVPNGTYAYRIQGLAGWHQSTIPYAGVLTVSGHDVAVTTLAFSEFTSAVTFNETGLPSGVAWTVNVSGVLHTSYAGTISFELANGTYLYTVYAAGYAAVPPSGPVVVAGAGLGISTFFSVGYSVTFQRPSGTTPGAVWNATLSGSLNVPDGATELALAVVVNQTKSSTGAAIVFFVPQGSYVWLVTVSGLPSYVGRGSVSPSPSNPNPTIVPPSVNPGPSGFAAQFWAIFPYLAPVIAAALAILATLLVVRRRHRRTEESVRRVEYFQAYVPRAGSKGGEPQVLFVGYVPPAALPYAPPAEPIASEPAPTPVEAWEPSAGPTPKPESETRSSASARASEEESGNAGGTTQEVGESSSPPPERKKGDKRGPVFEDWAPEDQ